MTVRPLGSVNGASPDSFSYQRIPSGDGSHVLASAGNSSQAVRLVRSSGGDSGPLVVRPPS